MRAAKPHIVTDEDQSASSMENLALVAKALGHPARLSIVQVLQSRTTCVGCDIVEEIGLAQSTTSEHLRILKAAGIIVGEIYRPRICYSLNPSALDALKNFLNLITFSAPIEDDAIVNLDDDQSS